MKVNLSISEADVPHITFSVVRHGVSRLRPITKTAHAVKIGRALIPDDGREHFAVVLLSSLNHVLGWHQVGIGGVSSVLSSSREIFGAALRTPGCAAIIAVHSHPSGDPKPSKHDQRLTRDLARAAKLMDYGWIFTLSLGAAWTTPSRLARVPGNVELQRYAIREAPGTVSLKQRDPFADRPSRSTVTLPPGRARLTTIPCSTGSRTPSMTTNRLRHLHGRKRSRRSKGHEDVDVCLNEFRRNLWHWLQSVSKPPVFDHGIFTRGKSEVTQPLLGRIVPAPMQCTPRAARASRAPGDHHQGQLGW